MFADVKVKVTGIQSRIKKIRKKLPNFNKVGFQSQKRDLVKNLHLKLQ